MDQTPKFLKEYEKAQKKYQTNKSQAIQLLKAALKNPPCDNQGDNWYNYFTVKIQLAGWMRDQQKLEDSNAILTEVIVLVKSPSITDKIESLDLKKVKFSAFQNFAKLLIQQACKDMENQNYADYRKKMNGSYNYFRQAQSILLEMMGKQMKRKGFIKNQWIQWYMRYLCNVNELLLTEIELFKDQTCINNMFRIVKTAERLYELKKNKEEIKDDMQAHLHKCYYNKAIALRASNKFDEALALLVKVYNFQKARGFQDDLEKSRTQILKVLFSKNDLIKVNTYYDKAKDQQLYPINQIKARRQKIRKAISSPTHQQKQYNKQFILDLFADYDDKITQRNLFKFDYQLMNEFVEKVLNFTGPNTVERGLLSYYMAEANYHLQHYQKSYRMICEALKIPTHDMFEVRNNKIEKIQILAKWKPNSPEIPTLIDQILKEINQELFNCRNQEVAVDLVENQKEDLATVLIMWKKARDKANEKTRYELYNDEEEKLLQELQHTQQKYHKILLQDKKKFGPNIYQISSDSAEQAVNEKSKYFAVFQPKQNQKLFMLQPQDQYSKKCKEKNVAQRPQVKSLLLKQSNFNPFEQILNISIEQMQILLSIIKTSNLDLRNHSINDRLLQCLLKCPDFNLIKQFKINGACNLQNQLLAKVISKMEQLTCLSFLDFSVHKPSNFNLLQMRNNPERMDIENQKPRSIVHIIYLLGKSTNLQISQNLKVLKLKYCNLLDNHLQQMQLQNYKHLREVSLSHNLLQGKQLHRIFSLNQISAVNLTDNPLKTLNFDRWSERLSSRQFVLKSLKLKNIEFNQQLRHQLKFAIYRVQLLDLSQSKELPLLFDQIVDRYWQSGIQFTYLSTLIMKNVELDNIHVSNIFSVFRKLREVDFRGCVYGSSTHIAIEQKINDDLDIKIKVSQRKAQTLPVNKFKLGTVQNH